MYESLMGTLRTFFGYGALRVALGIAVPLVAAGLVAAAVPALRRALAALREAAGWRGALTGWIVGGFKLLAVFVLARLLIVAMMHQAGVFAGQHGRVTETNRSAVEMKWGVPHEQRELQVAHTEKKTWVTRQLKLPGEKGDIVTESYWSEQERPVQAVGGQMPTVISVSSEERGVDVEQKPIAGADVTVRVRNNPRRLGNANYAGYEDFWTLAYTVPNVHARPTTAQMTFPLPAARGVFNRLSLKVDGRDLLGEARSCETEDGNGALTWSVPMATGQQCVVEVSYESRGLEHLRYIPRPMTQTGHYRVGIEVQGIPAGELDFPIGSMPPEEKLAEISGTPYTLHWNLDNALTSYDIGIKLPRARQPDYHFARLLDEAPVGLLLLLALLVIPRLVTGSPLSLAVVTLLALAYYLQYTLMGTLADVFDDFAWPFALGAVLIAHVVAYFRLFSGGCRFLAWQDSIAFALLAVAYPLAVVDAGRTGLWMQLFYTAMLIYVCVLVARRLRRGDAD